MAFTTSLKRTLKKYVPLKRKYRFLKPHEKIQYGDWMNGSKESLDLVDPTKYSCSGWIPVHNLSPESFGQTVKEYCPNGNCEYMYFARFVDCVPIK